MGLEQEIKFCAHSDQTLQAMEKSDVIRPYLQGQFAQIAMQTIYWDTADGFLSEKKWTLRSRMENENQVVTLKTPQDAAYTRGEWNFDGARYMQGSAIHPSAFAALVAQGAPEEILVLADKKLTAVCGVRFIRRCSILRLPDGTSAELALDSGVLYREDRQQSFAEVELERKTGSFAQVQQFAGRLQDCFKLTEEPLSKFQRANRC